ncbi:MAG TPA: DUF554 domain-containing protein [Firmicutes bacterium]|nr:DUF554 domain-containing protein [Bacillota bacterium]
MEGTIINAVAVVVGGLLGLALGGRLPGQVVESIMHGVSLSVLLVGLEMGLRSRNAVIVLLSVVLGGIIGEALRLEERFNRLSHRVEERYTRGGDGRFTRGFVAASLLYCVGPMAITGAFQNGLLGEYSILVTKSFLDGISAVALAAGLGYGVLFSAVPVFLYQGALALGATWLKPLLSAEVVTEMTATGGVLILGIALTMLQIKKIRVANFLPALGVVVPLVYLWSLLK